MLIFSQSPAIARLAPYRLNVNPEWLDDFHLYRIAWAVPARYRNDLKKAYNTAYNKPKHHNAIVKPKKGNGISDSSRRRYKKAAQELGISVEQLRANPDLYRRQERGINPIPAKIRRPELYKGGKPKLKPDKQIKPRKRKAKPTPQPPRKRGRPPKSATPAPRKPGRPRRAPPIGGESLTLRRESAGADRLDFDFL